VKHLTEEARALLELSDELRIRELKNGPWIGYPRSEELLAALEDLLHHPPSHRMPNMLIIGKTNNGKTAVAQTFLSLHKPNYDPTAEADDIPVLYIQAPPVPDERRFNAALLDRLRVPHKVNERADRMLFQLLAVMPRLGVKMLMIDEIHHILAGNMQKQRAFLNVLKYIGNELQVPIVALGTGDALFALQTDAQLAIPDPTTLIVIDEADRLRMTSLEQLRSIFDASGLGMVLIGMPGIEKRIARYPQFYSRIGFVHEFRPLGPVEVELLLEQHWSSLSSLTQAPSPQAVRAIIRVTGGNFRLLTRLLTQMERVVDINRLTALSEAVVETARENLVIGHA